ncbi:MAG TPA: ABC transporter permease subunit [Thermoanaerobaculia bacterium]|nr:ABC transporter permease subunit [Thermoanaerobaculia bacterium]
MNAAAVRTVAASEFRAATRLKWIRWFAAAFALLVVGAAWSAGALAEISGAESFARTTVALVPLTLVLVPLTALLLGVTGQSGEPGTEAFFFAQPVGRFEVVVGKWAGQAAALSAAIGLGFGGGALVVAGSAGARGLPRFLFFVAVSAVLGAVFLAIAAAISAAVARRATAMGVAAFAWFFFVLLEDSAALAAAGALTGRAGARALYLSVFANPAAIARVLALSVAGTPHVLGAAGDAWAFFLGGPVIAAAVAGGALLLWAAGSLAGAGRLIGRRDL